MIPGIVAGGNVAGGGGITGQYWNPADKAANVGLSDSNKLATVTSSAWYAVRSLTSHASDKFYAELVYVAGINTRVTLGLATSTMALNNYVGVGTTSWGLQAGGGPNARLLNNGVSLGSVSDVAVGSYVRVAVDFDAGNAWVGNASAYVGGGDPAAGTSPSFTFTPSTALYLAAGLNGAAATAQGRIRTGSSDMSGTVPAGFTPWG